MLLNCTDEVFGKEKVKGSAQVSEPCKGKFMHALMTKAYRGAFRVSSARTLAAAG
jgi:hypothetical protein